MEDKKYGFYAENTEELNKRISEIEISIDDLEANGEREKGNGSLLQKYGKNSKKGIHGFQHNPEKTKINNVISLV